MAPLLVLLPLLVSLSSVPASSSSSSSSFRDAAAAALFFPGFRRAAAAGNITLSGVAEIDGRGVLRLTNETGRLMGHAFYPSPLRFKSSPDGGVSSFSASFVFAVVPEYPKLGGHGLAFVVSAARDFRALPSQYLGLLNASDMGNSSNHLFAVEFDTVQDFEFGDINDNHVGIDINSLVSNASAPTAYYAAGDDSTKLDLNLKSAEKKHPHTALAIGISVLSVVLVVSAVLLAVVIVRRIKNADVVEEWELEIGPHRFSYQELKQATNGFKEKQLLGQGGFGKVYRGTLPSSKIQVAVKRISHESKQGLREFVSEISSIGRLRHRNLVQLLGWCRKRGDLLLVYEYMANGSLDMYLFDEPKATLGEYNEGEVMAVLKLGLLCSNCNPTERPTMRQVVRYLDGEVDVPEVATSPSSYDCTKAGQGHRFEDFRLSFPSSSFDKMSSTSFVANRDASFASLLTSPISILTGRGESG
ncbi:hypothetical protein NL676_018436 [Syzygium grande]|nr:hypothetical protein NL676_018436 [Syzygium grande]